MKYVKSIGCICLLVISVVVLCFALEDSKLSFNATRGWNLFSLPTMNNTMWMDCTVIQNGTQYSLQEAGENQIIQSTIYYYEDSAYKFTPGDSDYILPYKGYWLYSFADNLTVECP